jgi:predicted transcriptional regulator
LDSKKTGKERTYAPLIMHYEYMLAETGGFLGRFHDNSIIGLVNTLYDGKKLTDAEIADLRLWLKKEKIERGK